jgi:hypothetical protein
VETTPAYEEAEPATVEEAQAQLGRAVSELRAVTLGGTGGGAGSQPTTTGIAGGETKSAETPAADRPADARCVTGCRAITSMRRAVAAICRLAGEQDGRCTDARKTLGDSETKVAGCGC